MYNIFVNLFESFFSFFFILASKLREMIGREAVPVQEGQEFHRWETVSQWEGPRVDAE